MTDLPAAGAVLAHDAVARRVRGSGTSFYAAMCLLPKARRQAMFAIYAFCREVDDIADEPASPESKRERLNEWRAEIARIYDGASPAHPTGAALLPHVRAFGLGRQDFLDVIDGMEMDALADIRGPNWAELDLYCDRVASAVGRLSVRAFGAEGPAAIKVAHHLGRALQLTNILRDLKEDADRGRLYLPREVLESHGLAGLAPSKVIADARLPRAAREVAERARGHFQVAADAMRGCRRASMRPARLMGAVYRELLDRMTRDDWKDPGRRISLSRWRKAWLILRHGIV